MTLPGGPTPPPARRPMPIPMPARLPCSRAERTTPARCCLSDRRSQPSPARTVPVPQAAQRWGDHPVCCRVVCRPAVKPIDRRTAVETMIGSRVPAVRIPVAAAHGGIPSRSGRRVWVAQGHLRRPGYRAIIE